MNIRSSTLTLLLINTALLAALAWIVSAPAEPEWLPAETSARAPERVSAGSLPTLPDARRSATWMKPIFSRDRQPDAVQQIADTKPLTHLTLTGVVLDGESKWAYLREQGNPGFKLALGTTLDNGWTLSELTGNTATFIRHGQTQTLSLPMARLPQPSKASAITLPRIQTP